jgi:copper chaperone CopZ
MKKLVIVTALVAVPLFGALAWKSSGSSADAAQTAAAAATTTLHIEGMTCAGCATAVKLVLQKTPGVSAASVSYEQKRAVVTFDPRKTTPAKIATTLAGELSYKVSVDDRARSAIMPTEKPAETPHAACATTPATSARAITLAPYRTQDLRTEFNRARDRVRVVALLSPTCGECQNGQRVVERVFTTFPKDERLRGFVVWLPMLPSDSVDVAGAQAATFVDPRVVQQWDGEKAFGTLLSKTLRLERTAWDVYLLYAPGVEWTGNEPPKPSFRMHQLRVRSGADQKICLDPKVFVGKVTDLLKAKGSST